jgi:glycosyltransferase involved in cell wall biosynthesis
MKIVFINRYFHPDHSATSQILSDLAFELARRGFSITVVASRQLYDKPDVVLAAQDSVEGVTVHRVKTTRFGRNNLAGRAVDYVTFYISAFFLLARLVRKGDILVAKTDPPMLSIIAAPVAFLRRAHLVNWLQDIFPEVAEQLGVGGGRLSRAAYGLMRSARNATLKHASANVVLGEVMAERVRGLGVSARKVRIIQNWSDTALVYPVDAVENPLRHTWDLDGKFVVGYSGNLGRAHEYQTFLDAIAKTEAQSANVRWLFIGGGALFEDFKAQVAQHRLASVVFKPYQPRDQLALSLSAADVHLVSLRPELEGLIVPSKFYGIAAAGRPTIFIGDHDGEIARILRDHSCGDTVPMGNGAALAAQILRQAEHPERSIEMGRNARLLTESKLDRRYAAGQWAGLLDEIAAKPEHSTT